MQETLGTARVAHVGWYAAPIASFLATSADEVLGVLAGASSFCDEVDQKRAWTEEIRLLRTALEGFDGWLYLEFDIPRLGSRVDAVVITGAAVIPIEFKVGVAKHLRADMEQAWDYGLDLKNFHEASHHAEIFPLLVATEANEADAGWDPPHVDGVRPPRRCNVKALPDALRAGRSQAGGGAIDGEAWGTSPYRPTPTIIQAARALYARHTVEAISRADAGAANLRVTSKRVEEVIDEAQRDGAKAIVFVTGVPGAGNLEQTRNFMARRKNRAGFAQSEPEFLLAYMDRHRDWAAVICLVGGGQEINTGEAGIGAWLDAVRTAFPHWRVYVSPDLTVAEYAAKGAASDDSSPGERNPQAPSSIPCAAGTSSPSSTSRFRSTRPRRSRATCASTAPPSRPGRRCGRGTGSPSSARGGPTTCCPRQTAS